MKKKMSLAIIVACVLAFAAFPPCARAESDEYTDSGNDEGIPAWSVARLNVVDGSAWVLPPGESDWQEYEGNAPLPKGSRIRVAEDSSVDIGFSGGNRARLSEGTDLEIRDLREDRVSLKLYEGTATFQLPQDDFFFPVNTTLPDGQIVRFAKPGRYRIETTGSGEENVVKVREGEAGIKVGESKYRVRAGEEASVGAGVVIGRLPDDRSFEDVPAPPEMTSVERSVEAPPTVVYELRDYGEWVSAPSYGPVWRPRVAAGWSPYYFGRWVWTASFGWSWVSDEPWGWYPYRCGNWINDPFFGWCWTPYGSFVSVSWSSGFRHYRPRSFYPATVRFVREGGNVRWVPLRPGERFNRPSVPRNDRVLTGWRQPLPRQTVFARDPARHGGETPQWRDTHIDRPTRQPAVRPAPVVRPTPAVRQNPGMRPDERFRGRDTGNVTNAPGPVRERPQLRPAPFRAPRPEVRAAPERIVPGPQPAYRDRVQERAPRIEMAPAPPPREGRPDPGPRDDSRNRDAAGPSDNGRGDRGGWRGVR